MPNVGDTVKLRLMGDADHSATVVAVNNDDTLDLRIEGKPVKPLKRIARSDEPRPFTWRPS